MTYINWLYLGLLVVVAHGAFSGGVSADELVAVCVLGFTYAAGGTHGLYLGWTHEKRMTAWADRFVGRAEQENVHQIPSTENQPKESAA